METSAGAASAVSEARVQDRLTTPGQFLAVAAQLGLLALVIRQFQIENSAFLRMTLLAFSGFLVHAFLPRASGRLFFFCSLSPAWVSCSGWKTGHGSWAWGCS